MNQEQILVSTLLISFYQMYQNGKVLLIASPAWGKTTLILQLYQNKTFRKIVFISPLVALNLEFKKKLLLHQIPVIDSLEEKLPKVGVLLFTPEKIICRNWELSIENWADLVVVDEFHLLEMWQSFRPKLRECWYWLSGIDSKLLVMSGTFNWNSWQSSDDGKFWLENSRHFLKLDLHQKKLLNEPTHSLYFSKIFKMALVILTKLLFLMCPWKKVLVFFPSREQVVRWNRWCSKYHISSLFCLGGQTAKFNLGLEENSNPQVIICTSVLSHGVNLPARDIIIIFGTTWEEEIWTQMKSRGGRKGENYILLSEKQVWMK